MLKRVFFVLAIFIAILSFLPNASARSDISSFSVFATNSVWIRQGAILSSGDVGVKDISPGPWLNSRSEIAIGRRVNIPDDIAIYGDTVKIKTNASVFDVHYNELKNNGSIRGTEHSPLQLPLDVSLPHFPTPVPGTESHDIALGETLTLEPGAYGEIVVRRNAALILTGGTYHFENLDIGGGGGSKVLFQAPTELIINQRLEPGRNAVIGPEQGSGVGAKDILIYVNGINGDTGNLRALPKAVAIGIHNTLVANIYAPNGTIWVKQGSVVEGALIGKNVKVGFGVDVDLDSGFGDELSASIYAEPAAIAQGGTSILSWNCTNADSAHIDNGIGIVNPNDSIAVSPDHTTTYTITAIGPEGSANAQIAVMVTGIPEQLPEGSFGKPYEDLIPPDSTVDSYDSKRFSLITGKVQDLAGSFLAGVSITIHGHPEYGTVATDTEGRFTIPVEGGGTLTVIYQKDGFISAQRKVYALWNDIAIAETIQMITEDTASTTINFNSDPNMVVTHQSTTVTDEFGSRSASLVFTGDNRAYLVDENGNDVMELTTITTRATEYSTPESMPAKLPPTSAYTYCVELSVDGAQRVRFDKPVTIWVDNFLGFDVGIAAPVGFYDRDRGVWVPEENGRVVELLDTDTDNVVDALDADGDGQPDDLNANGSFIDEVKGLGNAQKYRAGSTFWRVALNHFSPCDINWARRTIANYTPLIAQGSEEWILPNPEGESAIEGAKPEEPVKLPEKDKCLSSYVENRSRIFHEDIPIPGTDITLHYASNRVDGYHYGITVPASGETVPDGLKKILVKANVAGRTFEQILDPLPNQKAEFTWDGLDHLGRRVKSVATAKVDVGFVYDAVYTVPPELERAFAIVGQDLTSVLTRQDATLWKKSDLEVPILPRKRHGTLAEGWTLSIQHQLDSKEPPTLHKGDGTIYRNEAVIVETIAGIGLGGYSGDGGPATEARVDPDSVALDSVGNFYIAQYRQNRIRKVGTDGIITSVAGDGTAGYSGDGGPATDALLNGPDSVALDSAGNIYIADRRNHRVRKVDKDGIITTVAGNGVSGYSGDQGPATEAEIRYPRALAFDNENNYYIATESPYHIRKVSADGIITTVAGTGSYGYSGDGGLASEAQIGWIAGMTVDLTGNLYFAVTSHDVIRKIDTAGIITTVAGNGTEGYSGDGGPAAEAQLDNPSGVTLDTEGIIYIADGRNHVVRKVDGGGKISTYAGKEVSYGSDILYGGDGGPPTQAIFNTISDVALDALGDLYISSGSRVRKVAPPSSFSGLTTGEDIPFADDNGLGYIMSGSGLHKNTIDRDTGSVLREFGYDENNNLSTIIDQFNNQITIQRDANGVPTAIVSPDNLTTTLSIDPNNHLTRVTYPGGSHYDFEYTPDGLMTAEIEPEENRFDHSFSSLGRLTDVFDEQGGHWNYTRTAYENGEIITVITSGEGNVTSFRDRTDLTGAYTSTITDPTGAETLFSQSADGLAVDKSLPCGMELGYAYDVDSEYKFKYLKEMAEKSPSGLERVTVKEKSYEDTDLNGVTDLITESVAVNDKATTIVHNTLAAQKTITSPEGRTVTSLYDPSTLLTQSISIPGLYDTTYGYDTRGRLLSISTNTRESTFAYNPEGFLESVTDPENQTTTYGYDPVGRIIDISRPDGGSVGFTYDKNGNMTVLTNPVDVGHGFGFNTVNRNSSYATPLSGSYSYIYDKDRRLIQTNFPSGQAIINDYADPSDPDDKSRLWQIRTPEGNIDFTYLCGTKVDTITKGSESITYGYDGKLVTSEALGGRLNLSLGYTYNNDFDVSGFTYAGAPVAYSYDNDGLLTGAGAFTITRNANNGLPESVTGGALNLARTFNGYGEVDSQATTVSSQNVAAWSLVRDNNGRITNKTETVDSATSVYVYTYDTMGRLLTVTKDSALVEEYQYDLNGTRTYEMNSLRGISGRNFTYSDEDHLLSAGTVIYSYDLDGFLTTKTDGSDVTNYRYSSRGELLSVNLPDGRIIEYIHDPLGRRIAKKINSAIVEKYLWQGLTRLLAVYDASDTLLMRFEYADGRIPVAMTSAGSTYYLTYDQVGSLRLVADSAGNVIKSLEYDSFGNIINDSSSTFAVQFGFAGGLYDRDTGLVRFGYRDYDPDVGRWTAKDPIFFAGGDTDLYGYVLNDPVNLFDPWGLIWAATNTNYHGISNWARGLLMYASELIGSGMDPIAPGDDSFIGGTKTTTQTWQADPKNTSRDSEYPLGTKRVFDQTYIKHMRGPNDLTNNFPDLYYYRWEPYVSDLTYDNVPGGKTY